MNSDVLSAAVANDVTSNKQQIVQFENDLGTIDSSIVAPIPMDSYYLQSMDDPLTNDICDFLARPSVIETIEWSPKDAAKTAIGYYQFPQVMLGNAMLLQKMDGFYGMRADVVVRVQTNAQPFQQGRLLMTYIPNFAGVYAAQQNRINLIYSELNYITQLPRVELDLGSSTEMVLRMPYITPELYTNLNTMKPDFGRFEVTVYSPLLSGGEEQLPVDVTIWAHYENVKLFYPTQAYIQSGNGKVSKPRRGGKHVDTRAKELESVRLGPISSVSNVISNVAAALLPVPFLSDIVAPIKWVADIVTGTASAFGWSKPTTEGQAEAMQLHTCYRMANSDGVDTSQKLSLLSTNIVSPLPGFAGTDLDEMDIRRVACQFAFWQTVKWTKSQGLLFSASTNLADYCISTSSGLGNNSLPCSYVANMFQYHRSSIDFKFKFIKTKFHSGRVMFVFMPGVLVAPTVLNGSQDYSYKVVIDLRESSEIIVRVPYVSTMPYLEPLQNIGTVAMYVLNDLVGPPSVSDTVEIIVEVAAGPDCEFANPMPNFAPGVNVVANKPGKHDELMTLYPPSIFDTDARASIIAPWKEKVDKYALPTSRSKYFVAVVDGHKPSMDPHVFGSSTKHVDFAPEVVTPQSGVFSGDQDSVTTNVIDGTATSIVYEPAKFCIGERVTSFRQLLKRFSRYGEWNALASSDTHLIFPYYLPVKNTINKAQTYYDWLSYISSMYMLHRGSIRIKYRIDGAETYTASLTRTHNDFNRTNYQQKITLVPSAEILVSHSLAGAVEVEVPQYHQTHSYYMICDNIGTDTNGAHVNKNVLAITTSGLIKGQIPYIYRAAGDDYTSGFFYGTMVMLPL